MLSGAHLALGTAFVFLAFVVRGFTGFGTALVAIPLLVLLLDFKVAVVAISLLSLVNGIPLAYQARRDCALGEIKPLFGGFLVGMAAGTGALLYLSGASLKRVFGLFVAAFAFRLLYVPQEGGSKRCSLRLGWAAGVASGVVGGMFGASGPPAVIYLYRRLGNRQALRATILVYFLISDVVRVATYLGAGMISPAVLRTSLWFIPASLLGSWSGARLQRRVSDVAFRRCICVLLLITGVLFVFGK